MAAAQCLICLEDISQPLLLPCNHSDVCLRCFMTMTHCYGVRTCPCCQAEVTEDPIIAESLCPADYRLELFKNYTHDTTFGFFYKDPAVLEQLKALMAFHCGICGQAFAAFKQFAAHASGAHHQRVCKICSRAKRALPSQVEAFNATQFKKHMKRHPVCPCCKFVAFDDTMLAEHVRENHFRCDVCAAEGKVLWFADVDLLRVHYHECHYACEDPMCVEQGFIVFATPMELQLHRAQVHGDTSPVYVDFKGSAPDVKEEDEHRERVAKARKSLGSMIKSNFPGDKSKNGEVFSLLDAYQRRKMSPMKFLQKLSEVCGDKADYMFCSIVAAIHDPGLRGQLVRERSGIRPCRIPGKSRAKPLNIGEDFPELGAAPPAPEPPVAAQQAPPQNPQGGRKKGKQKRIVIASF